MSLYRKLKRLLKPILKFLFRYTFLDLPQTLPDEGVIVCSNHISNWDALLLAVALEREITFMGKEELLKAPIIGRIVKEVGMIPLSRNGGDAAKLRQAVRELKSGKLIVIFPQGHRQKRSPAETEFQPGVGMIALLSNALVLPVGIYTRHFRPHLFRKAALKFGVPHRYEIPPAEGRAEEARLLTEQIRRDVISLTESAKGAV